MHDLTYVYLPIRRLRLRNDLYCVGWALNSTHSCQVILLGDRGTYAWVACPGPYSAFCGGWESNLWPHAGECDALHLGHRATREQMWLWGENAGVPYRSVFRTRSCLSSGNSQMAVRKSRVECKKGGAGEIVGFPLFGGKFVLSRLLWTCSSTSVWENYSFQVLFVWRSFISVLQLIPRQSPLKNPGKWICFVWEVAALCYRVCWKGIWSGAKYFICLAVFDGYPWFLCTVNPSLSLQLNDVCNETLLIGRKTPIFVRRHLSTMYSVYPVL